MALARTYIELGNETPASQAPTEEFLMRCLLGAREQASRPSNDAGFDEDVNVYLVGLLTSLMGADYHDRLRRYHFRWDQDLAREVASAADPRFTYEVYRTNADHLLVGIGLLHHVEGAARPGLPHLHREREEFSGRGSTYYALASSSLRRLRRRSTGTEVAMEKLGARFEDYARVLGHLRTAYFHFSARLSEARIFHLLRPAETDPARAQSEAYDAFLDAFSAWKAQPGPQSLDELRTRVQTVRELDPEFRFRLPGEEEA